MSEGFDGCKFCRNQALHVEELEEKIRQLEAKVYGREWQSPLEFGLTPVQDVMLAAMVQQERTCSIFFLIEATRGITNTRADYPDNECIRTQMSTMRKRLGPHGIEVITVYGRGYRLTEESRQRLLDWNTPNTKQDAAKAA